MTNWPTSEEVENAFGPPVRSESMEWTVDGVTLRATVPVRRFDGRESIVGADGARAELLAAIALVKRRHLGPEGLRFMRSAIGATVVELAGALGVVERTVRRWETGDIVPDHAIVAAYHRAVVEHSEGRDALEWLRLLDTPETRPGDIIDVDAA